MRKSLLLTALFLVFSFAGIAQEWHGITSDSPVQMKKTLVSSTENEIVVEVAISGFYTKTVTTPNGKQAVVYGDRMATELEAGAPQLAYDAIPVIIGDMAEMTVNVVKSSYVDYENVEVAPSKGNFSRQINPEDVPYTYGEMYQQDAFWPATQAYLEAPYIMRDFRGQNIMVRPFAYNPVTKTLRVYTNMTIAMKKVSENGKNQKAARKSNTIKLTPEYKANYDRRFINFGETAAKYTFDEDFGEMLIICTDAYMDNLQPLVEWKNKSGRPTTLVSLTTAGGNNIENIKTYVSNFYNDPSHNLEFVLLVGEYTDLTPKYLGSGAGGSVYSDNYIGKLEGNDDYLEVLVGRFSVANAADADLQVSKTIYYERDVVAGATWGNKGLGIGYIGAGSGHYGEDDYQHIDFIRDTLLHYTYAQVTNHHGGSGGTASTTTLNNTINEGVSIINYCNHGSETAWSVANYSTSNVAALTNDGKLPIVWSVACLNGKFDVGTCFAESWLRAKNNSTNAPTGAVGGMFSYVSQPWVPPMYGQDEMVAILAEWRSVDQFNHTMGGASLNGSMYVLDMAPNDSYQTFNSWLLFGDPSLIIRTDIPVEMDVTVSPAAPMLGMSSLTVSADAAYGIVTLSTEEGEVLATAKLVNGEAQLEFAPFSNVETLNLVVMGYNKVTYNGTIDVLPAEGAYVTVSSYAMSVDQANFGETIDMDIEVKNVGVDPASNITAVLSTECEFVEIIESEGSVASLAPDQIATMEGFQFAVAADVPDMTKAQFLLDITDGTNTWQGKFNIVLHAPVITVENITKSDDNLEFTFKNAGSAPFNGGMLNIYSSSIDLTFNEPTIIFDDVVESDATITLSSGYSVASGVEPGTTFEVAYDMISGLLSVEDVIVISYGIVMEDFESGTFGDGWTLSSQYPWAITQGGYSSNYCAKSTNEGASNSEGSMTLTVDVVAAGDLTFMYKVSSENNYDKLHFYMDNQEQGVWSGTVDWTQFTQPVTPGTHTFKWSYTKDSSVNTGSDCAWVDNIIFPPTAVITFIEPVTNLVANVDDATVSLTWVASRDADSYIVKRDGVTVGTVTETSFVEEIEESGTYRYSVFAAKENGQISAPVSTTVVLNFLGVSENEMVKVGVYPNPTNGPLNIVTDADNFEYQVVNAIGQVVLSGNANGRTTISVSGLNSGVYFLKVVANGSASVRKVIVR